MIPAPEQPPPVVAIPARNEEALIGPCLAALGNQAGAPAPDVLLLLNNTTDRTAEAAWAASHGLRLRLFLRRHDFPTSEHTAGHARRLAMQHAVALARPGAPLLCTDADGQVAPDWLAANLFHMRQGVDAVAGRAVIDPVDAARIPAHLHAADERECAYAALLDQIASLVDPDPDDPWPRHTEHSGASMCVTQAAYHQAGGLPAVGLGEDRAFFAALRRIDARIRHAPEVRVTVSGRVVGRARGGMADTMRRRMIAPDPFIDDALEPALDRVRRLRLRARLRAARQDPSLIAGLAAELCWPVERVAEAAGLPTFGAAWSVLEEGCPCLASRPVPTGELEAEIARAVRLRDGLLRLHSAANVAEAAD